MKPDVHTRRPDGISMAEEQLSRQLAEAAYTVFARDIVKKINTGEHPFTAELPTLAQTLGQIAYVAIRLSSDLTMRYIIQGHHERFYPEIDKIRVSLASEGFLLEPAKPEARIPREFSAINQEISGDTAVRALYILLSKIDTATFGTSRYVQPTHLSNESTGNGQIRISRWTYDLSDTLALTLSLRERAYKQNSATIPYNSRNAEYSFSLIPRPISPQEIRAIDLEFIDMLLHDDTGPEALMERIASQDPEGKHNAHYLSIPVPACITHDDIDLFIQASILERPAIKSVFPVSRIISSLITVNSASQDYHTLILHLTEDDAHRAARNRQWRIAHIEQKVDRMFNGIEEIPPDSL